MALDKTEMKDSIMTEVQAINARLTASESTFLNQYLEAFCEGIIKHFKAKANIKMDAADFAVDPATFNIGGAPVTGQGANSSFDLQGKIE